MPNRSNVDAQIQDRIQAFTAELSDLVKAAAMDAVQEALGGQASSAARRPTPKKAASRKATKRAGSGKRIRRSAEDLEALSGQLVAYVKANPGARLEEISAGMGIASKDLKRPVTLLLEAKKLRKTGQKRGTQYFAGKGGGAKKKAAKKRASKKKAAKSRTSKKKRSAKKRGGTGKRTSKRAA